MRFLRLLFALLLGACLYANEVQVTVSGSAGIENPDYRSLALADALRNAVQQGAGVNLVSETQVKDFQLSYDRVFTASFGYVRDYQITKEDVQFGKIYTVTVTAKVGEGTPDLNDELSLRHLIQRRGSPKLGIVVKSENITGFQGAVSPTATWFKQAASNLRLNLGLIDKNEIAAAANAQRLTDNNDESAARAALASYSNRFDYVLEVAVQGSLAREQAQLGQASWVGDIFYDLTLYEPSTGRVIAAVAPEKPVAVYPEAATNDPTALAVDAINQAFTVSTDSNPTANEIFRKMLASYVADLDMGRIMQVQISGLTLEIQQALTTNLPLDSKTTLVSVRRFDSKGQSELEIQTRYEPSALAGRIQAASGGALALETIEHSRLYFAGPNATGATTAKQGGSLSGSPTEVLLSGAEDLAQAAGWDEAKGPMPLLLIGGGIIFVLVLIIVLVLVAKKKPAPQETK